MAINRLAVETKLTVEGRETFYDVGAAINKWSPFLFCFLRIAYSVQVTSSGHSSWRTAMRVGLISIITGVLV